jgi:hypothetical protein
MLKLLIVSFAFICSIICCHAQELFIKGTITDAANRIPLSHASVYLNNTTIGTYTNNQGQFVIGPLKPGQYDVVASYVGYDAAIATILLLQTSVTKDFMLEPKAKKLQEILVLSNNTRQQYLQIFKQHLLGFTLEAQKSKIINLDDVQFLAGETKDEILAWCDNELLIENPTLGYTIHFSLADFYYHKITGSTYFFGFTRYENKTENGYVKKRWKRNRQKNYEGSSKHFFESLVNGRLQQEGFEVLRLKPIQKPTIDSTAKTIKITVNRGGTMAYKPAADDSLLYYNANSEPGYKTYLLDIKDGWLIYYKKTTHIKAEIMHKFLLTHQPLTGTGAGLRTNDGEPIIDEYGNVLNPRTLYYDGVWSFERLANMLPQDYQPSK